VKRGGRRTAGCFSNGSAGGHRVQSPIHARVAVSCKQRSRTSGPCSASAACFGRARFRAGRIRRRIRSAADL